MTRTQAAALAAAIACAVLAVLWLLPPAAAPDAASGPRLAPQAGAAVFASAQGSAMPPPAQRAADGMGLDVFLTGDLRYRLEALLLEAGEAPSPATLKERLAGLVPRHFTTADATRALALLERYVDYRVALGSVRPPADPGDPQALRAAIQARQRIRTQHFTEEEYQALFAQEDELDRHTLVRLEIERDHTLTDDQKQAALAAAESELGALHRAARTEALAHLTAAAQTAAFEANAVSEHERHVRRRARHGDAAAAQLAQLDREERDWQHRLDTYLAAQGARADPQQLQQLRGRLFTAEEQLRVEAALALRSQAAPTSTQR